MLSPELKKPRPRGEGAVFQQQGYTGTFLNMMRTDRGSTGICGR